MTNALITVNSMSADKEFYDDLIDVRADLSTFEPVPKIWAQCAFPPLIAHADVSDGASGLHREY